MSPDQLKEQIDRCKRVVDEINGSGVFQIVLEDARTMADEADEKWAYVVDEKQLDHLRIIKLSCLHLLGIKDQYATQLASLENELEETTHPDAFISKDFDNEGAK